MATRFQTVARKRLVGDADGGQLTDRGARSKLDRLDVVSEGLECGREGRVRCAFPRAVSPAVVLVVELPVVVLPGRLGVEGKLVVVPVEC